MPTFMERLFGKRKEIVFTQLVIFTKRSVLCIKVACQGIRSCEHDYIATGRKEVGLDTLNFQRHFESLKASGEQKCDDSYLSFTFFWLSV